MHSYICVCNFCIFHSFFSTIRFFFLRNFEIMDEDLKKIKQLINSKNNQNLYMGFHMLKNYKKYEKGEFKEFFKLMFIQTKKVFKLNIENEVCIYFRVYKPPNYRYQSPTPDVFHTK